MSSSIATYVNVDVVLNDLCVLDSMIVLHQLFQFVFQTVWIMSPKVKDPIVFMFYPLVYKYIAKDIR